MEFRENPERMYLVQHCFEKTSLGMNLEDFVALFADNKNCSKMTKDHASRVASRIQIVQMFPTPKKETGLKKLQSTDLDVVTPRKRKFSGLTFDLTSDDENTKLSKVNIKGTATSKKAAKSTKPAGKKTETERDKRAAARTNNKTVTELFKEDEAVKAITDYFKSRKPKGQNPDWFTTMDRLSWYTDNPSEEPLSGVDAQRNRVRE